MLSTISKNDAKLDTERERRPSCRQLSYSMLVAAGLTPCEAKIKCGYNPKTPVAAARLDDIPMQSRLEAAAQAVGICAESNLSVLGSIGYDEDEASSDRISAIKAANDMLGWRAPDKVDVVNHKLTQVNVLINAIRGEGLSIGDILRNNKEL